MPLYEYQCDACAHRFEKIQKFSDPNEDTCPKCGGKVQKLISSPAIQFKGSGFYITDYAKKPSSESGGRKSSDQSPSDKGDSSKSDGSKGDSSKSDSSKGDSSKSDSASSSDSSTNSSKSSDSAPSSSSSKE